MKEKVDEIAALEYKYGEDKAQILFEKTESERIFREISEENHLQRSNYEQCIVDPNIKINE